MCPRRAHNGWILLVALALGLGASAARAQDTVRPTIEITPSARPDPTVTLTEQLQLEAFINGRSTNLIAAFVRKPDGTLAAKASELDEIGLKVPENLKKEIAPIPLALLPGVSYRYDEPTQSIFITATMAAQKPHLINGRQVDADPQHPQRPPLGAVLNYTLFASADGGPGGPNFSGLSAAFDTRLFGHFGMVESGFIARVAGAGRSEFTRLNTSFIRDDPEKLTVVQAGDLISGGFSWTRPIRMGGLQYRRSFDLRPDLVTIPIPALTGSAAATSTLDLFINGVRAVSADVPAGPFQIDRPPLIYGGGTAQVVVRDALGRETVSSTPFYASPQLLAPSLSDFSAELGFARRNFAISSNDYDKRLLGSFSLRRGLTDTLTIQAHAEFAGTRFASVGGGALFTVGTLGLASTAISASHAPGKTGALVNLSFESRHPGFSVLLRAQRTMGNYQDLASVTADRASVLPGALPGVLPIHVDRIFVQPRAIEQATVSVPSFWRGGQFGLSYIQSRAVERSRIANLSFTQSIGRFSLYASGVHDFAVRHSSGFFVGLSMPLGGRTNLSGGASRSRGATNAYVQASRQGGAGPGSFGWTVRAAEGERSEIEAGARYETGFARFEATATHFQKQTSATALMEGGIAFVGGDVAFAQRLDQSFALVKVGAPGVAISRENRLVGRTGRNGMLLVPELAAYTPNRLALDPAGLPLDADVSMTAATATPYARQPAVVDMTVRVDTGAALLSITLPDGSALPVASRIILDGTTDQNIVGYDGQAYLEGLKAINRLVAQTPAGRRCVATFPFRAIPGRQVRIAVTCRPQ